MNIFKGGVLLLLAGSLLAQQVVTIEEVQGHSDSSPYEGQTVTVYGIVTAGSAWVHDLRGFFIQEAPGAWHGVFVYRGQNPVTVQPGDSVRVTGTVQEYYGLTEISLSAPTDVEVLAQGRPIPAPVQVQTGDIATGSPNAEQYEGVLVQVGPAVVVNDDLGYGEWGVDDGSGMCRIDDAAGYTYTPQVGDTLLAILGPLHFTYGDFKMEPRGDADIIQTANGTGLVTLSPGVVPPEEHLDTLAVTLQGVVPVALTTVELTLPADFDWSGSPDSVRLTGPGYANAALEVLGSGTPGDPYRIRIEDAAVTPEDPGTAHLVGVVSAPEPGTYPLVVATAATGTPVALVDTPKIQVISIDGSGTVEYMPQELYRGMPTDLSITLRGELGTLSIVEIDLPDSGLYWPGSYALNGPGFIGASATVLPGGLLRITQAHVTAQNYGNVVLHGVEVTGEATFYTIDVRTAGAGGTPTSIETPPTYMVVRADSTYPLAYFHTPGVQERLVGRQVRVRGTVVATLGAQIYIQDSTGGIVLYNPSPVPDLGTRVWALGVYAPYANLEELSNPTVIRSIPEFPYDTTVATAADLGEALEGRLIRINGLHLDAPVTLVSENSYTFADSTGTFSVYIDRDAGLDGVVIPAGDLDLLGVLSQHYDTYQLNPRFARDFVLKGNGSGQARFVPIFKPYRDTGDTLLLEIRPTGLPLQALQIAVDSVVPVSGFALEGNGFAGATLTDSTDAEGRRIARISGALITDPDTIWIFVAGPPTEPGQIPVEVRSSIDAEGLLIPLMEQPRFYYTTPIARVQAPGPDGYTSALVGQRVLVGGVVTFPAGISNTDRTSIFLQDETGGVNLYYAPALLDYRVGDVLLATGAVTEYNGLTEVSVGDAADLLLLDHNAALPDTYRLRPGEVLKESLEGRFVELNGGVVATAPVPAGAGYSMELWNGQVPVTVYLYPTTGIDLAELQPGTRIRTLYGVVGQYDSQEPYTSGYQLLPRFPEDVVLDTTPPSPTVDLRLSTNVFAPSLPSERLRIQVLGPPEYAYTLKLYDSRGRLVHTFFRDAPARTGTLSWDGRTASGERLPVGLYILQLEALHGADTRVVRRTLVISAPFK